MTNLICYRKKLSVSQPLKYSLGPKNIDFPASRSLWKHWIHCTGLFHLHCTEPVEAEMGSVGFVMESWLPWGERDLCQGCQGSCISLLECSLSPGTCTESFHGLTRDGPSTAMALKSFDGFNCWFFTHISPFIPEFLILPPSLVDLHKQTGTTGLDIML